MVARPTYQVAVRLTMSLGAARQVIWQGKRPREQMGQLLDLKRVGYRDLAWAVEGAFKPHASGAAGCFLLTCSSNRGCWSRPPALDRKSLDRVATRGLRKLAQLKRPV